jgi:hypothetical protein
MHLDAEEGRLGPPRPGSQRPEARAEREVQGGHEEIEGAIPPTTIVPPGSPGPADIPVRSRKT